MKHIQILAALCALTFAMTQPVQAACFADYKAKRGDPLELHYGVMQVDSCKKKAAKPQVTSRLKQNGWTLLKILSVFEADAPDSKRKKRAGKYYLAF